MLRMKMHLSVTIATNPDRSDVRIAGHGLVAAGGRSRWLDTDRGYIGAKEYHMGIEQFDGASVQC